MVARPPEYQFLREFIDMMFGILFILGVLRFTLFCVKYVLAPVKLFFEGIMCLLGLISDKSKEFVEDYEEEMNGKKVKIEKPNITKTKVKTTTIDEVPKYSSNTDNSKVIDFAKFKKK